MALTATQTWQPHFGPFGLPHFTIMPAGSKKYFLEYAGRGDQDPDNHIRAFNTACGVLGVLEEDVYVRLFVKSLVDDAAAWFQHLEYGCITGWRVLENKFLARFKPAVNVGSLLCQLFKIQKEEDEEKRSLVDRFNRTLTKIPQVDQPSQANLLSIFIAALHPEVRFHLKRSKVRDLEIAKQEAVRIEDDLFLSSWFQQDDIAKVSSPDLKLKDEPTSDKSKSSLDDCDKPSRKRVCLYEQQCHSEVKPKMKRLVLKTARPTSSISDCQITTAFGAKDLVMPPLFESNPHNTMGSYHLHVEYDDEDSQEVIPEESNSFDMTGRCCSHIENNSEHIFQSDDSMNHLSMPPMEEEPTENKLNVSLPMAISYPIFGSFSFEVPNAVSAINIKQESMADQYDKGRIHEEETKGIFQADEKMEYETFLLHYQSSREEWSQPDTQGDFYTPTNCSRGLNANLQPKIKSQLGNLQETEAITFIHDSEDSQKGKPLICSGRGDTLQTMDGSACETKTKFEGLNDKWTWGELNPLYLPTGFHGHDVVRENPLFRIQGSTSGGGNHLSPFGIEDAETNVLQGKPQRPWKVSTNTLSHSEEVLFQFFLANKEGIALMKTPGISLFNSSVLDQEFSNPLTARDDRFVLTENDPMPEKARFYLEGILSSEKSLSFADPKSTCIENVTPPVSEVFEQVLFQWYVGNRIENSLQNARENLDFYDERCLFGRDDWWIRFPRMISLRYHEGEFAKWKWYWVAPCRHNSLFRKGSFFSQPVNGFV